MKEFIEIPFGAKDSELGGWEYNIPEGMEATIVDNKIVVKQKESEDEKVRKELYDFCIKCSRGETIINKREEFQRWAAWLEKQGEHNPYSGVSFKYNGHTWEMCARDNGVDILLDKQLFKHLEKQGVQKPTDEEMKILLQTEYEKGKADAIEAVMKAVTKDKESAIKFLKSAGIINDNGTLAKEYAVDGVEQNTTWSEWDEKIYNLLYEKYKDLAYYSHSRNKAEDIPGEILGWLKSIKERVQSQPKQE